MDGTLIRAGRVGRRMLVALAAGLALASTAGAAQPTSIPPQGLYDQCSPAAALPTCIEHLDTFAAASFTLVLNYTVWDATPDQIVAYADAARDRGISIIWPLNNVVWRRGGDISSVYPKLSRACGCTQAAELLPFVMGLVTRHSATWGWYVGDEVAPAEAPAVAALTATVKRIDPATRTLYIGYEHSGTRGANLWPFARSADVVGTDSYPYGTDVEAVPQVQFVADLTRQVSQASGHSSAMVLQAFDWAAHQDEYPGAKGFPDRAFMQAARDAALKTTPALLLWYSYPEILRSSDPDGHWRDLAAAAMAPPPAPVGAIGTALMANWTRSASRTSGSSMVKRPTVRTRGRSARARRMARSASLARRLAARRGL